MKLFKAGLTSKKESLQPPTEDTEVNRLRHVKVIPLGSTEVSEEITDQSFRASITNKLWSPRLLTSMVELSDGTIVTGSSCHPLLPISRWTSDFSRLIKTYGTIQEDSQVFMEVDGCCVGDTNSNGNLYFVSKRIRRYVVWNANTGAIALKLPLKMTLIQQNNKGACLLFRETKKDKLSIWRVCGGKQKMKKQLIGKHQFSSLICQILYLNCQPFSTR